MSIEWMNPVWLILLPILAGILLLIGRKGKFPSPFRRNLHMAVRFLVCALLIFSMAGPGFSKKAEETATVFLVDASASVQGETQSREFLQQAYEAKGEKDSLGLILFGKNAGVEQKPSKENTLPTGDFLTYVDESATDLAAALKLAASVLPERAAKRIVLLSDGEETVGDARREAGTLAEQGISLDVFQMTPPNTEEVQLTAMELPKAVNRNAEYEIALRIDSNVDTAAEVRLYQGNALIGREQVSLFQGESRIAFKAQAEQGGTASFRGEILPEKDTERRNNKAYAFTYIDDIPRVLLLGSAGDTAEWKKILESGGVEVVQRAAQAAPAALEKLAEYQTVILANVAAKELPDGFLTLLEGYVRTLGGGLLVSGGENAYALGGYQNTALEELLPVKMELKTEGEAPDLTMIMVIDRSGSMTDGAYGVTRLEMAKEAAIRSLEGFGPKDWLGILAFDDQPQWAVPLQKTEGNQEEIIQAIGRIQPGGGTSILPALREAAAAMAQSDTKQKHILLLTDGQAEQEGYDGLLEEMKEKGITLSSVAVGGGADAKLLKRLAEQGGGRYYFTDEFTDLPEIFAKETLLAGKEYINEREFYPKQQDASAVLSGISALPPLEGYIGTTAKPRGDSVLVSDREEPILSTWQYGLGRTAAWTADVHNQWSKQWLASEEGTRLLRNLASWTMRSAGKGEGELTAQSMGEESRLFLEMPYEEGIASVTATVLSSLGESYEATLKATAPGSFEGELPTAEEGVYTADIAVKKQDGTETHQGMSFALSYPKEYDMTRKGDGEALLSRLAAAAGGRTLLFGEEVFDGETADTLSRRDMRMPLLLAALLLFLVDIALRRFSFIGDGLERILLRYGELGKKKKTAEKKLRSLKEEKESESSEQQKKKEATEKKPPAKAEPAAQSTAEKLAAAKRNRRK